MIKFLHGQEEFNLLGSITLCEISICPGLAAKKHDYCGHAYLSTGLSDVRAPITLFPNLGHGSPLVIGLHLRADCNLNGAMGESSIAPFLHCN